jgi:ubiquinone/menaquinone biosynthesis C-methylase UbiE
MDPTPGSETQLEWTGERLTPGAQADAIAEHLHRYALARELAAGRAVLDIACGEGYGSALLAHVAREVTGVDVDAATVAHAQRKYTRANLRFIEGSATAIPLPDHAVDIAVSFETIEHLADHEGMLRELRRVLRAGGTLLISSPDRREYSERAHYQNPHHVEELDAAEFEGLLRRHFAHVALLAQRMVYGSAIAGGEEGGALQTYAGGFEGIESARGLPHARYWIAICSDAPIEPLPPSIFEDAPEGQKLGAVSTVYRVEKSGGLIRRIRSALTLANPWRLETELPCKVRSFTVTLRGAAPADVCAVRALVREKTFEGRVAEGAFAIEVNFGSGRHPCVIEARTANGDWGEVMRVRVDAPNVNFEAHEHRL